MSMIIDLHFSPLPEDAIERDRWGRPLIGGEPFTRASTVSKALDDQGNLITWVAERTLLGAALRRDLVDAAYAARDDKRRLRELAEEAKTAAGGSSGANRGTAIHGLVEQFIRGDLVPSDIPDASQREDVRAILDALDGYEVLASETFVADRRGRVAGTCDLLLRRGGRSFVADLKTSSGDIRYLLGPTAVQTAAYAGSQPYDPRCDEPWGSWPSDFDPTVGLLIHSPVGRASVTMVGLDLAYARRGLDLAIAVRQWRSGHMAGVRSKHAL